MCRTMKWVFVEYSHGLIIALSWGDLWGALSIVQNDDYMEQWCKSHQNTIFNVITNFALVMVFLVLKLLVWSIFVNKKKLRATYCNFSYDKSENMWTHNCHDLIYKEYVQYLIGSGYTWTYLCLILTCGKFSCKNASIIATSFRNTWVIYVVAFSTKDLFIWYWAYYLIWWQNLMHITDIDFFLHLHQQVGSRDFLAALGLFIDASSEIRYVLHVPIWFLIKISNHE